MGLFTKKYKVGGTIVYHGLANWWLTTFSDDERAYMEQAFAKVGNGSFTSGPVPRSAGGTAGSFLVGMATHFSTKKDAGIALKILAKSEELIQPSSGVLDTHFTYGQCIKMYYKLREDEHAFELAIAYCEKQIELAPRAANAFKRAYPESGLPSHPGFTQLAIIRDKQGDYEEAIRLCEEAKRQGWGLGVSRGPEDWDKRISRYRKKLEKQSTSNKPKTGPSAEPTPTHIQFECHHCNHLLKVPMQYSGMRGKCNNCGKEITAPGEPNVSK